MFIDQECDLFVDEFVKKDTPTLLKLGHAANYLQVEGALDTICDALAQNIGSNSQDLKKNFMNYFEKCAKVFFFWLAPTMLIKYLFLDAMFPFLFCVPFLCWLYPLIQEQVLEPKKNLNGDSRIRLSNKLLAKQKKELKGLHDVKVKILRHLSFFTWLAKIFILLTTWIYSLISIYFHHSLIIFLLVW